MSESPVGTDQFPACVVEPERPRPARWILELTVVDDEAGLLELARVADGRRISSMLLAGDELVELMIRLGFGGDLVPVEPPPGSGGERSTSNGRERAQHREE